MATNRELQTRGGLLRLGENGFRIIGSVLLGIGLATAAMIVGEAARVGMAEVPTATTTADFVFFAGGVLLRDLSASLGRSADVIDAELYRREAE